MSITFTQNFYNPYPQFTTDNGSPLSGGSVTFYDAGTSTLKAVYTDRALSVPAQNPQPLGLDGRTEDGALFLGAGIYDVEVKDSLGAQVWFASDVQGSLDSGTELVSFAVVANIDALRNLTAGYAGVVLVLDYYTNDRGGGFFEWDNTSTATDDGGSVFAPISNPPTGRWLRKFFGQNGVLGDQFGVVPSVPSIEGFLGNARNYCSSTGLSLTIRAGTYNLGANISMFGNFTLILDGAIFDSSVGATLTLNTQGLSIPNFSPVITGSAVLIVQTPTDWVSPTWWGAVGDGLTDSYSGFVRMTGRHSSPVLIDRRFKLDATGAPSILQITLRDTIMTQDGRLNVTYTDAGKVDLGFVTFPSLGIRLLEATDLAVFAISNRLLPVRAFMQQILSGKVQVTNTLFTALRTAFPATSKGLLWDAYDFLLVSLPNTAWTHECVISLGSVIYTNNATRFGYIQAGQTQYIFAKDAGGISITPENGIVYAPWYGVRSGDETADFDFCVASSSAKVIDFAGVSFQYNPALVTTINRNMRNGSIEFTSVNAVLLGNTRSESMSFNGLCETASSANQNFVNCIFSSAYDITNAVTARFTACTFDSNVDWFSIPVGGDMTFQGCTFNGFVRYGIASGALGTYGAKFTGCAFKASYVSTPNHFNNCKLSSCDFSDLARVDIGQSVVMAGCEFRNQNNQILLAQTGSSQSNMEVMITNCTFGRITVNGGAISNANTTVSSILIFGNVVYPEGSFVMPYNGITTTSFTNIATSGHGCYISNNKPIFIAMGRQGSSFGDVTITLASSTASNVNTDNMVLPTSPTTTSGAANPAMDVDTFRYITT